jgi:hypothetical protein
MASFMLEAMGQENGNRMRMKSKQEEKRVGEVKMGSWREMQLCRIMGRGLFQK